MTEPAFVVVDASVWVARLVPQDAFHVVVAGWLEAQRFANVMLVSPALLLAEVAGAIARRTANNQLAQQAVDRLQDLPGLRLVSMDDILVHDAARLAAELGLRGADSLYVALALRLKLPLVTLDMDQKERAANRIAIVDIVV